MNNELFNKVNTILFQDWDPLSVNDRGPSDEYSAYVPHLLVLINSNASREEIATHLNTLVINMASADDYAHCLKVADKLLQI
ncbi:MAG TPA: hypothetical protein VK167_09980 [Flavipsychrobacter sp.]|nr:hypothetical protein [Flavipsychrobacter sp.]